MNTDEIKLIESALNLSLPQHYIALVTNYPPELIETEAPDYGLLDNPRQIIDENLMVRTEGYFGEEWPDKYIIIGQNGCGDYYVVLKGSTEFSVGFSDHEIMACNPFANSKEEFISKLIDEMGY